MAVGEGRQSPFEDERNDRGRRRRQDSTSIDIEDIDMVIEASYGETFTLKTKQQSEPDIHLHIGKEDFDPEPEEMREIFAKYFASEDITDHPEEILTSPISQNTSDMNHPEAIRKGAKRDALSAFYEAVLLSTLGVGVIGILAAVLAGSISFAVFFTVGFIFLVSVLHKASDQVRFEVMPFAKW